MRKEIYRIKCPKRIIFGDPQYFKEFKGVDYMPPKHFNAAQLVLQEQFNQGFPKYTYRTMTLYLAPRRIIDVYVDDKFYTSQMIDGKFIGVDTARYYLSIDGRDDIIRTGADGWWGKFEEYYREKRKGRILDAVALTVAIPEEQDFNWMKQMAGYFFEDMKPVTPQKQKRKESPPHNLYWL